MPDDTLDFTPVEPEDLLAPTEERFYECGPCAIQPGSPRLCVECLERRAEHLASGRSRRPTYHRLQNDSERRAYLSYLAFYRDGGAEMQRDETWTDADLDREFPDRHEPPYREFSERERERNRWRRGSIVPSIWGPMQVSRLERYYAPPFQHRGLQTQQNEVPSSAAFSRHPIRTIFSTCRPRLQLPEGTWNQH